MKILTVVGARPQFIKAMAVSRAISDGEGLEEVIVHTGQHFDVAMSDVFFNELGIPTPKHNLGIGGGSHGANTGRMLERIEAVLQSERPDWVLVYGDTDSTLAGALAAAKLCIPVAHVEAGLRSFNRAMPEEINRILTDHASDMLFCPTDGAVVHLAREGISGPQVRAVGDVMYDVALIVTPLTIGRPLLADELGLARGTYAVITIHRKESTDDPVRLSGLLNGIGKAGIPAILPLHPRTRKMIAEFGLSTPSNIRLIDPVGYLDMVGLVANARVVGTDSGGLQKEAFFHRRPCVTFRDETEWTELVDIAANVLTGADSDAIATALNAATPLLDFPALYGHGDASQQIVAALAG